MGLGLALRMAAHRSSLITQSSSLISDAKVLHFNLPLRLNAKFCKVRANERDAAELKGRSY